MNIKWWSFNKGCLDRLERCQDSLRPDDGVLAVTGNLDTKPDLGWVAYAQTRCADLRLPLQTLTAGFAKAREINRVAACHGVNLEPKVPGFHPHPSYAALAAEFANHLSVGLTLTGRLVFPSRWDGVSYQWDYGALGLLCPIHVQTQSFAGNPFRWREALTELADQFEGRGLPLPTIQISVGSLGNGVPAADAVDRIVEAEARGFENVVIQYALKDQEQPRDFLQLLRGS